jgi:hypothetical protein
MRSQRHFGYSLAVARLIPAVIDDSTPQSERAVLHVEADAGILCEVHKAKPPGQLYVAASRAKHVLYDVEEAAAEAQAVLP